MANRTGCIMFQGTGSGVGKSVLVAAFCRVLWQKGLRVAPFKAQNMALNSFVTLDGLEMGRAQVYQAEACGLLPDVRMNPILLKPTGDSQSQVILMGKPAGNLAARSYYSSYQENLKVVRQAFDSLSRDFDLLVLEGAGSPAEINLQATDLVNMEMAAYADAPVVIVGDIDRGGVFAWFKGTYDLIPERHRARISGFIINKFRGDISLLSPGIAQFQQIIPLPVFGVLPWFNNIVADQEDGVFVNAVPKKNHDGPLKIAVVHLPRISNFTDFAPLAFEGDVVLSFVRRPEELDRCDCLIIPGTKNTRSDLNFLKDTGWDITIHDRAKDETVIMGICGGYQMLGMEIGDPDGVEGQQGSSSGLGLLPVVTDMCDKKKLSRTEITLVLPSLSQNPLTVKGYEIHMGVTRAEGSFIPLGPGLGADIGAVTENMTAIGIYLHGLFENDSFRRYFLDFLLTRQGLEPAKKVVSYSAFRKEQLDRLAGWVSDNADIPGLLSLMGL
ncbi:MAG: cobyric acid synthase [Thermodesulfobacteriota bacterium]|nr:cobyric acid synthase [Thermodesulfobacteriota bacterium]